MGSKSQKKRKQPYLPACKNYLTKSLDKVKLEVLNFFETPLTLFAIVSVLALNSYWIPTEFELNLHRHEFVEY